MTQNFVPIILVDYYVYGSSTLKKTMSELNFLSRHLPFWAMFERSTYRDLERIIENISVSSGTNQQNRRLIFITEKLTGITPVHIGDVELDGRNLFFFLEYWWFLFNTF